eukprot:Rhum_TRINITY_DN14340_c8_g2::Rhum_TRINITY_DN14340_c8_g2_i1::g.83567::m.83567
MDRESSHRTITRRLRVIVCYLLIVIVYLVIGGACMQALEEQKEDDDLAAKAILVSELNITDAKKDKLEEIGLCTFPTKHTKHWTFTGSVFFSLTVITTIGYGSFAPKTLGGRTFTVFYAMFGISVIGILLANLALVIAELFKSVAARCWLPANEVNPKHLITAKEAFRRTGPIHGSQLRSIIISLAEIPDAEWDEDRDGRIFSDVCNRYQDRSGQFDREAVVRAIVRWHVVRESRPAAVSKRMLLLMFFLCSFWICAWAGAFHTIEGWGYFDSIWYACVTLSTIGFGDFVPESAVGRLTAFFFIAPGIGMVAAFLAGLTTWFEVWRFWTLQSLHESGRVSDKIMVAQGVGVSLKTREGVHRVPREALPMREDDDDAAPAASAALLSPRSDAGDGEEDDNVFVLGEGEELMEVYDDDDDAAPGVAPAASATSAGANGDGDGDGGETVVRGSLPVSGALGSEGGASSLPDRPLSASLSVSGRSKQARGVTASPPHARKGGGGGGGGPLLRMGSSPPLRPAGAPPQHGSGYRYSVGSDPFADMVHGGPLRSSAASSSPLQKATTGRSYQAFPVPRSAVSSGKLVLSVQTAGANGRSGPPSRSPPPRMQHPMQSR